MPFSSSFLIGQLVSAMRVKSCLEILEMRNSGEVSHAISFADSILMWMPLFKVKLSCDKATAKITYKYKVCFTSVIRVTLLQLYE